MTKRIADMTPEQIERRRVANMTPEQIERKRAHNRVANMTPEQIKNKRRRDLRKKFGISLEEYEDLWEKQLGLCAICQRPETQAAKNGVTRWLSVDHDHETGAPRALLCHACNLGIGKFGDSPERIRRAAEYLEKHKQAYEFVRKSAA